MVGLATAAAIIASQALISGAFSLTQQAIQLGYCPRLDIEHTSHHEIGQVYVPQVNWALMLSTIAIVIGFGSSTALAAAYGIAVTLTMVITAVLLQVVATERWGWPPAVAYTVTGIFLTIDLAFFGANALKIAHGGWLPLVIGGLLFTLMTTWKTGRQLVAARLTARAIPIEEFLAAVDTTPPARVPGTAVFMTAQPRGTPPALAHNLRYNKVLHEHVVTLMVTTQPIPHVPGDQRVVVRPLGHGVFDVIARYGFMEDPNVPEALGRAKEHGLELDEADVTYFLGRETLIVTRTPGMATWREKLFVLMARNAVRATTFFRLPPERVVELGVQVEILRRGQPAMTSAARSDASRLVVASIAVAVVTLVLGQWLRVSNAAIVSTTYLMVVLLVAATSRLRVAVMTSIAAMLCLNFFFLPPVGTFTIADPQNWVALFAFLAVSLVASNLSAVARARADEALGRRNELARLFDLSRDVLQMTESREALSVLARSIARRFDLEFVAIAVPREGDWDVYEPGASVDRHRQTRTGERVRCGPGDARVRRLRSNICRSQDDHD